MFKNIFLSGPIFSVILFAIGYSILPREWLMKWYSLEDALFGLAVTAVFTGVTLATLINRKYIKIGYLLTVIHLAFVVPSFFAVSFGSDQPFLIGLMPSHFYFGVFLILPALLMNRFIYREESTKIFNYLDRKIIYIILVVLIVLYALSIFGIL